MNQLAFNLLRLLSDGVPHTLPSLASQLNLTNEKVIGVLKELQSSEIDLVLTHDFQCRWLNPVHWLDERKILSFLDNEDIRLNIIALVDSTNSYIKKNFL